MLLSLIGTGNVAAALGNAFLEAGHSIQQVYDRKFNAAQKLAKQLNANPVSDLKELSLGSDVYLLCVSDDAIENVARQILLKEILCVHTSGATSIDVLKKKFVQCGVIYPVQTISAKRKLNFKEIPVCIEASNKHVERQLKNLAISISDNVQHINSEQRLYLHLAAVFANNFANRLYSDAADLLEDQHLSFRLLNPLILETALKAIELDPRKVQTGPAARNDQLTIKKHLQLLEFYPGLRKVYHLLTKQIQQQQKN